MLTYILKGIHAVPALTVLNIERFTSCSGAFLVPYLLPRDLLIPSALEFFFTGSGAAWLCGCQIGDGCDWGIAVVLVLVLGLDFGHPVGAMEPGLVI